MFSACFGVYTNSSLSSCAVLYAPVCVLGCLRDPLRLRIVFFHAGAPLPPKSAAAATSVGANHQTARNTQVSHPVALVLGVVAGCVARTLAVAGSPARTACSTHPYAPDRTHLRPGIRSRSEGGVLLWRDTTSPDAGRSWGRISSWLVPQLTPEGRTARPRLHLRRIDPGDELCLALAIQHRSPLTAAFAPAQGGLQPLQHTALANRLDVHQLTRPLSDGGPWVIHGSASGRDHRSAKPVSSSRSVALRSMMYASSLSPLPV